MTLLDDVARLLSGRAIPMPEPEEWPLSPDDRLRGAMFAGRLQAARHEPFTPLEVCRMRGSSACRPYCVLYGGILMEQCWRCPHGGAAKGEAARMNNEEGGSP